ncbi:MAG: 50S ribosomal protein L27 [Candidatus Omnitrophica bacterium]|nr:50S ribosomal protein L27 [Candidatus Omnitrophota bacterium]
MGGRVGGISSKFYAETAGIKVSGGQKVKAGTILTREGNRWQAGLNVNGRSSLTAAIEGNVYFTRKKNAAKKVITYINIKPVV